MTVRNRPFGALGILLIATLASTAGAKGKEDETKPGGVVAADKRADPAKPAQPATAGKPAQPAAPASAAQKAPGHADHGKDKGKDAKGQPAGNPPPHARSQGDHPEKTDEHEGEKKGHEGKAHEGHAGKGHEGHEGKGHGKDDPGAPGVEGGHRHGRGKHFGSAVRNLRDRFKEGKLSKDELKAQLEALNDDRKQRRERHREQLKERWGQRLAAPAAAAELRHHSRRMAHLNRMLLVTETEKKGADKDKLVARIEKLTELENQRHERKMNQIEAPVAAQ